MGFNTKMVYIYSLADLGAPPFWETSKGSCVQCQSSWETLGIEMARGDYLVEHFPIFKICQQKSP